MAQAAVRHSDRTAYTTTAVIIAGSDNPKNLGVPGEEELRGKAKRRDFLMQGKSRLKVTINNSCR